MRSNWRVRGRPAWFRDARDANHPADGTVTFDARTDTLEVQIDASSAEQLDGLKGAVERHLDRFAFREAPLTIDWLWTRYSGPALKLKEEQ